MRTEDGFPFIKIPGKKSIMFNEKDIEGYMATHKNNAIMESAII